MAAVVEPMAADPAKHRGELIERLDSLRRNERFCDVTVLVAVKDKEFNKRTSVRPSTNRLAEFCMVLSWYSGAQLWNNLPVDLRQASSLADFKSKLSRHSLK